MWLALFIMCATISPLTYASSGSPNLSGNSKVVSAVEIFLEFPEGPGLYSTIQERIIKSIEKVANTVLVGQEISSVKKTRVEVGKVLKVVFDKVLWGYQVKEVELIVADKTLIIVELQPTSKLIEDIRVDVQIEGVNAKIMQVVDGELALLEGKVVEVLQGLPIDALSWASDLIKPIIYHLVKWQIPGFEPGIELEIGPKIVIDVTLTPTGTVIEDIKLDVVTQSLPRLFSTALQNRLETDLQVFKGLPVELVDKYQDKIIQVIEEAVYSNGRNRYLYLNRKPEVGLGSTTNLKIDVDWIDYKMDLVGELNLGSNAPDSALYLSLGRKIGDRTTIKLQNKVTLDRLWGTYSVGLEHDFGIGINSKVNYTWQDAKIDVALDWRKDRYGVTLAQVYPGEITDLRISLNYYYGSHTRFSLNNEDRSLWFSIQHLL